MAPAKRVALISHRFGNIGHDFMAVGMEEIVRESLGEETCIKHFEQHHFFDMYPALHPLRLTHYLGHNYLKSFRNWLSEEEISKVLWRQTSDLTSFDLAIACGGPNIVQGVSQSPTMKLMFLHKFGAFKHHNVPVLDLGVGSGGFGIEKVPHSFEEAFDERDKDYFRRLFSYISFTSVRDEFARKLLLGQGYDAPLIPCAAIASGRRFERIAAPVSGEKFIVINFQKYGANEDWGQGVDPLKWQQIMREVIAILKQEHQIRFLCHNRAEQKLATEVDSSIPALFPKSFEEYAKIIAQVSVGIVSRIHAAVPLAGIGVPSIAIGTDTRLQTLEAMGLNTFYVKDVNVSTIVDQTGMLLSNLDAERKRLLALREATINSYAEIIKRYIR